MKDRLVRSQEDRMLGGVCGGLSTYLDIDPMIVRLFFVLLALADGIGVLLYMILWFVLPSEERPDSSFQERVYSSAYEMAQHSRRLAREVRQDWSTNRNPKIATIAGATLIIVGMFFLLRSLRLPWLQWLDADVIWPVLLIIGGIVILIRRGFRR